MPKTSVKKTAVKNILSIPVVSAKGEKKGVMKLPEKVFAAKINASLMTQYVRVYLSNQRKGNAWTKTRGDVAGSTRKIYRQKGTGRARHGAIRAPIFVGGGIAFGPRGANFSLGMPQKMRQKALYSSLTQKYQEGNILAVDGLNDETQKTKHMDAVFKKLADTKKLLVIADPKKDTFIPSIRNLPYVTIEADNSLNAYIVLNHSALLFTKNAMESFIKGKESV